jgi:hypothetical protein
MTIFFRVSLVISPSYFQEIGFFSCQAGWISVTPLTSFLVFPSFFLPGCDCDPAGQNHQGNDRGARREDRI